MSEATTDERPELTPVYPSREDPFVRGLSFQFGSPIGRFIGPSRSWWLPVRVALVVALIAIALGWAVKAPCNSNSNWADNKQYTTFCYSDVVAVTAASRVLDGKRPYKDVKTEYPVLIGGAMWVAATVANWAHPANSIEPFFDLTAALLGIALLIVVICTALLVGPTRRWDVVMVAAAPVWLMHAFTNWDLLATAFLALAMVMWAKRYPWLAGIFIGLGTATKLYPALMLVVLLPLAWRTGKWREFIAAVAGAAITWLLVTGPVYLWAPDGVKQFFVLNKTRPADWDSLWLLVENHTGLNFSTGHLNLYSALLFVAVVATVVMLTFVPKTRPRLPSLLLVLIVGFLFVNKVHSPQYSVWLIPIVVLAYPRWLIFLVWQISEVALTIVRYLFFVHLANDKQGVPQGGFEAAVVFRDVMLLLIVGLVIRGMFNPKHDPVRATGVDDPAGGVFDGAEDVDAANAPSDERQSVSA